MSLAATLPATILDTILARLALLFLAGAGGDLAAARHAAGQMLAAHHPRTADELRLAAEIVGFGFHALEALAQAADPAMSLSLKLRLRGSAVSLNREGHKARRALDQLQKGRDTRTPVQPVSQAPRTPPVGEKAIAPIETAMGTVKPAEKNDRLTWTQAFQQRQREKHLAKMQRKQQARQVLEQNAAASSNSLAAIGR